MKPSERAQLRLLPPPAVHFKVRVLTFALPLRDLLSDAGLGFNRSDVGAFERGQSWSWFRFYRGLDGVGGGGWFSPHPLSCGWCFLISFAGSRRAGVAPWDPPRGNSGTS